MRRESLDCRLINQPQLIAGLPWKIPVAVIGFFGYAMLIMRNWYLLPMGVILLMFLKGATRRDPLVMQVFMRHRSQATRYSPAPVCRVQMRFMNRRPFGYGRYDPN